MEKKDLREYFEQQKLQREKQDNLKSLLEELDASIKYYKGLTKESKVATKEDMEATKQIIEDLTEQISFVYGLSFDNLQLALRVFARVLN